MKRIDDKTVKFSIENDALYDRLALVMSSQELFQILVERALLAYIITNDFDGEYLVSKVEHDLLFKDRKFKTSLIRYDDGFEFRAEYLDYLDED